MTAPLLRVRELAVTFPGRVHDVTAVDGLSFDLHPGERVGVVGESGSGKSVACLAMMRLLDVPPARVSGQVHLGGTDLLALPDRQMRHFRGRRIAMIFQDPLSCLSPRLTVGQQIVEAVRAHRDVSRAQARRRAIELLDLVGIPASARWAGEYPHRLSGGMAQRVMIAVALSSDPDLIIADEPTTALDVTIEQQIIDLLLSLCRDSGTAVMLITHDLAVQARFAQRLMVMYAGRIVESGSVEQLFDRPDHPYTRALLSSATRMDRPAGTLLPTIPGLPASAGNRPSGCAFHPRCQQAQPSCRDQIPALVPRDDPTRLCACHFAGRLSAVAPRPTHAPAGRTAAEGPGQPGIADGSSR